jgi:hypothetical protein
MICCDQRPHVGVNGSEARSISNFGFESRSVFGGPRSRFAAARLVHSAEARHLLPSTAQTCATYQTHVRNPTSPCVPAQTCRRRGTYDGWPCAISDIRGGDRASLVGLSQLTRAELDELLKRVASHRKTIAELEGDLRAMAERVAQAEPKPDRRKPPRKR